MTALEYMPLFRPGTYLDYNRFRFEVMAMIAIGKKGPKDNLPQQLQEREYPNDRKHAINFIIYFIVSLEKSISGSGNFNFILSSLLTMI